MMHTGAVGVGQLLIATQPGRGGYFDRSVVLLLEHTAEGSLGVCLNRLSELPADSIQESFRDHLTPPARVFEGGPVNPNVAIVLGEPATTEAPPPGWERVIDEIGVVDLNFPPELMESSFSQLRLFVGLSGWAAGQLESELIRGSWFRASARPEDVFGHPAGLWRRVLRRLGGATGRWSTWTEEPSLN
ncbi:YqgE/AlgH family protein [Tessaracoccus sp. MC1679]|nr:YqgE/AlgH family protein [Tessaracoccus sp. MC1679]